MFHSAISRSATSRVVALRSPKGLPLLLASIALLLLLALPAAASERTLQLDPEATTVSFTLGATGHDVEGHLFMSQGDVTFDDAGGSASGEIAIDARKAETGNAKRDKTMHNKVLESESHPLIVFRPQKLAGEIATQGQSEVELIGTLTLLGEDHPLTMPAIVTIDGEDVEATATFTVPFIEWGLHDPSILFLRVAKEVEVTVEARGSLTSGSTMAAAGQE